MFYDERGQRTGFNYDRAPNQRRKKRHDHSESEWKESAQPEVHRAFNDDGTLGLAVLPPDFSL